VFPGTPRWQFSSRPKRIAKVSSFGGSFRFLVQKAERLAGKASGTMKRMKEMNEKVQRASRK